VHHAALSLGLGNSTQLTEVFAHWGLPKPPPVCQPSRIGEDQQATRTAYARVERVGWFKASRQLRAKPETLRAPFDRWGLGQPTGGVWRQASVFRRDRQAAVEAMELAVRVGSNTATERLGVGKRTLYQAWDRWALGRPTDRPAAAQRAHDARVAANRGRRASAEHPWHQLTVPAARRRRQAERAAAERELAGG
jgi:hypothetical protein